MCSWEDTMNLLRLTLRCSISTSVLAIAATSVPVLAQEATYTFEIPAQSLEASLRAYSRTTGQQITFDSVNLDGKRAPAISGRLDAREAIERLLNGTGLTARWGTSGVIVVHPIGALQNARMIRTASQQDLQQPPSDATAGDTDVPSDELIVVTGTRAAQQSSLNDQKNRDNVATVLDSDISGKFPDSSLAETMRRAPGVSFQRAERGGEGEFISIRGLDAGLNNIQINGVNAGSASGSEDRRVPLDVIQAGTVSEIVINKSLLPQHDGAGIGGALELNTRNPLTVKQTVVDLTLEGRYGEFSDKLGYTASGSVSTKFGDADQFGLTLAASYRKRRVQSFVYDVLGDFMPGQIPRTPDPDGSGFLDRQDLVKFQEMFGDDFTLDDFPSGDDLRIEDIRANKFDLTRENLSLTGAFGWDVSDSTRMLLSGSYNKSDETNKRSTIGFEQSDRYDVSGTGTPVNFYGSSPFIKVRGETEDQRRTNGNVVLKFDTENGPWLFSYGGGWSFATTDTPFSVEADFVLDDIDEDDPYGTGPLLPNVGPTGRRFIDFDLSTPVPTPLLLPAAYDALRDTSLLAFDGLEIFNEFERNDRYTVFADTTYEVGGDFLRNIRFGAKFERSDFSNVDAELFNDDEGIGADGNAGDEDFNLGETNLLDGTTGDTSNHGSPAGKDLFFYGYDRSALLAFGRNAVASIPAGSLPVARLETTEDIYAGYAQIFGETGPWQLIGGARVEYVKTKTDNFFTNDEDVVDAGGAAEVSTQNEGSYTTVLPRMQVNFRPHEDLVFRGAFFTSLARPNLDQLGELSVSFADQIVSDPANPGGTIEETALFVRLPNPALKPAYSYNFDLGAEWYFSKSGVLSANGYYKKIDKFIFEGITRSGTSGFGEDDLRDIPGFENVDFTEFDEVFVNQVANGESATIYGVEFNFNASLDDWIDEWYGGFGLLANLTLQRSETTVPVTNDYSRETRFFNSPNYLGNVALTYEKYGLDASISYAFQDHQVDSIEPWMNQDEWEQPYSSLDLRVEYTLPFEGMGKWAIFGRVSDITNGGDRPINYETKGPSKRYLDDSEFIGREWRFGVRARF